MKSRKSEIGFPVIRNGSGVLEFYCIECRQPTSGIPYSFGGGFACEACVRAYYRNRSPAEIAEELRCRGCQALRLIRKHQKGAFND